MLGKRKITMYKAESSVFSLFFVIITGFTQVYILFSDSPRTSVRTKTSYLGNVWVRDLSQHSEFVICRWTSYLTMTWGPCSDKYPTVSSCSSFFQKDKTTTGGKRQHGSITCFYSRRSPVTFLLLVSSKSLNFNVFIRVLEHRHQILFCLFAV